MIKNNKRQGWGTVPLQSKASICHHSTRQIQSLARSPLRDPGVTWAGGNFCYGEGRCLSLRLEGFVSFIPAYPVVPTHIWWPCTRKDPFLFPLSLVIQRRSTMTALEEGWGDSWFHNIPGVSRTHDFKEQAAVQAACCKQAWEADKKEPRWLAVM